MYVTLILHVFFDQENTTTRSEQRVVVQQERENNGVVATHVARRVRDDRETVECRDSRSEREVLLSQIRSQGDSIELANRYHGSRPCCQ